MRMPFDPVRRGGRGSLCFFALALAFAPAPGYSAVSIEVQPSIEKVRVALVDWELQSLVEAADAMTALDLPDPGQPGDLFWQNYWAGVAGFNAVLCSREDPEGPGDQPDLRSLVSRAEDSLNEALRSRPDHAECHAMLAVLNGLVISDRSWMALFKGPALMRHRAAAAEAESTSPRTAYLLGTAQLKRAKDESETREAIKTLREAVDLFRVETNQTRQPWEPDWGYDHTLLFLGEAHQALAEWSEAVTCFEQALKINPHLERARYGLEQCRSRTENKLS